MLELESMRRGLEAIFRFMLPKQNAEEFEVRKIYQHLQCLKAKGQKQKGGSESLCCLIRNQTGSFERGLVGYSKGIN